MHLNPAHQSVKSCVRYLCRAVSTLADIFLVFRTLLNCLKCIIYEDYYNYYTDFFELGQQKINFSFYELSLPDDDPFSTLKK